MPKKPVDALSEAIKGKNLPDKIVKPRKNKSSEEVKDVNDIKRLRIKKYGR